MTLFVLAYLLIGALIAWLISPLSWGDAALCVFLWPFILISRYDGGSEDGGDNDDDWNPPSGIT